MTPKPTFIHLIFMYFKDTERESISLKIEENKLKRPKIVFFTGTTADYLIFQKKSTKIEFRSFLTIFSDF